MKNPLQEAIEGAAPEHVAELLSVFGKDGNGKVITTFPMLLKEFTGLRKYKSSRVAVEEAEQKEEASKAQRAEVVEAFKKGGLIVESDDARVSAYMNLGEEEQVKFLKTQLPRPMSSSRQGEAAPKIKLAEGKGAEGEVKKDLAGMFPHSVGK